MVAAKKTAGARKKKSRKRVTKTAGVKKRSAAKKGKTVKVKKMRDTKQVMAEKKKAVSIPEQDTRSPEHDYVVQQMLMERSPKKQRVMLKRCIDRLQKVIAACRPRSVWGTLGLLLLGAFIGIAALIGFVQVTQNGLLLRLLMGTNLLHVDGIPIQVEEEIDISFRRPAVPDIPDDFRGVDLGEFWEVWRYIENDFVSEPEKNDGGVAVENDGEITRDELTTGAIKGLTFATEDRYTNFFLPKDAIDFEGEVIEGEIDGIGAYLTIDEDGVLEVVKPVENSPAARAGLRAGDIITTIDGVDSTWYNLSEAASHIRGLRGTAVTLGIYRAVTDETFDVTITRGRVEIPTVETEIRDGVFIITLLTFTKLTPQAFRDALEEFVASANEGGPTRVLLDVRGNMGGILSVSVYVAGLFLPENSPVLYEYAGTEKLKVYRTNEPAFKGGITPTMTVLVDGATASASEILAAALRHYSVADIVGTPTLGKGSVQAVKPVGNDNALLKITVAHWLTPAKESINGEGVIPDIDYLEELEMVYMEDPEADISEILLQKAIQHLKTKK